MSELDVTWTELANTYVPEDLRDRFIEEAEKSRWKPADGMHPMSPGLALQETLPQLVSQLRVTFVEVAYSQAWVMREDDHRLEPYTPDFMIHATILGARSRNGLRFYMLDLGTGVAPIALVDDAPERE